MPLTKEDRIKTVMGGGGHVVIGLTSKGEIGNPILGLILLPIGIFLYIMAQKNYDNHKPN